MTRDQDIERVLERWFTEGPTQMPDRLFEYVDHIDRLPQRRDARLMTRFVAMNSTLRLAAAAVVILIVGVAGAVFLTRPASVGTGPSPTPSAAPSAVPSVSAAPAVVPAQVQGNWVFKGTRPPPGWGSTLTIGPTELSFNHSSVASASSASLAGADRLALRWLVEGAGCLSDDEGTYTFSLSSDGSTLTFTPATDACADRSAFLAGDWARQACVYTDGWCLGDLQPGTYASGLFNAMSSLSTAYKYGQFRYTVPAGWANTQDASGNYTLARQDGPANAAIYLFRDVVPHAQGDDTCLGKAAPGVKRTPEAFATWLTTLPGLVTTEPVAVTIGGLNGFMIDLSLTSDWTQTCPYSQGRPLVSTFVDSYSGEGYDWNVGGEGSDNHARYVFLTQPAGNSLLIDIEAQDKATWDALVADAMPVVESFQFNP
jgi:hypothetical protein